MGKINKITCNTKKSRNNQSKYFENFSSKFFFRTEIEFCTEHRVNVLHNNGSRKLPETLADRRQMAQYDGKST